MKKIVFSILLVLGTNAFADQPVTKCHVFSYSEGSNYIESADLEPESNDSVYVYFKSHHFKVVNQAGALNWDIDGPSKFNLMGIAPNPTENTPVIVKFKSSNAFELRCFANH